MAAIVTKRIITDIKKTAPYLIRWSLWLPLGCSLKLHHIVRPDDDRCSHDHPWWFLRVIVWGGYFEEYGDRGQAAHRKPWRPWAPWRVYFCSRRFRHRITELPRGHSWTLVLCGPSNQEWGFFTRQGWMQWKAFVDAAWSNRVLWCDDGRTLNETEGPLKDSP